VPWDVAVAGTLHRDDITTPHGRRTSLGGSAVYGGLAAARHARVHINGIVGRDTASAFRALLDAASIDTDGMVVSDSPTFMWHAVHDFNRWVTASESAEPGCDPEWRPGLGEASRDAEVLFVGSMHPRMQRDIMRQSRAELIGSDSMTVFMDEDAALVREVARGSDVLFLNTAELATLTGADDWRSAARGLCGQGRLRAVVVKQGPDGAACVTATDIVEIAAHPVDRVVDPTGGGDTVAGGFLGLCAEQAHTDVGYFAEALAEGVRCAGDAVSAFGLEGLIAGGAERPADV
jgi:sugar/nucleoside kinase (ribokinase family)